MYHFTTRADDSHAVPIIILSIQTPKSFKKNIQYIGKVRRGLSN